jgi:chemotaxis protein histidine kinase CheA/ActR/RegA family two-component response regulator
MVGAKLIGEFSWAIENLLNRLINRTLDRTPDIMALMRNALVAVAALIEQLETGNAPSIDVGKLIEEANRLGAKQSGPTTAPARSTPAAKPSPASSPTTNMGATTVVAPVRPKQPAKATAVPGMDPVLRDIFCKEASGHLAAIRVYIAKCERMTAPYPVTEELHRACHTLSGTGKTAGVAMSTRVAEPLNHFIRKLFDNSIGLPMAGLQALREAVGAIEYVVAHINEDASYFSSHAVIVARLAELDQALDQEITQVSKLANSPSDEVGATLEAPIELSADFDSELEISLDSQTLSLQAPTLAQLTGKTGRVAQSEAFDSTDLIEVGLMTATELDLLERRFFGRSTPDMRVAAQAEPAAQMQVTAETARKTQSAARQGQGSARVQETARGWDAVADGKAAGVAGSVKVNASASGSSRARFEPAVAPASPSDATRRGPDKSEAVPEAKEDAEDLFSNTDLDLLLSSKAPAEEPTKAPPAVVEEAAEADAVENEAEAPESVAEAVLLQTRGRVERPAMPMPMPMPMPALAVVGGATTADGAVSERTWASERDDEPRAVAPPIGHTGATSEWEEIFAISTVVTQSSTFNAASLRREPPSASDAAATQAPASAKAPAVAPAPMPPPVKPLEPDWIRALDSFASFPEERGAAPTVKPAPGPSARNTSETALFAADIEGALERLARDELRERNQRSREEMGRAPVAASEESLPVADPMEPEVILAAEPIDDDQADDEPAEEELLEEGLLEEELLEEEQEEQIELAGDAGSDELAGMVVEEAPPEESGSDVTDAYVEDELLLDEAGSLDLGTGTDVRLPALVESTHTRLPALAAEEEDEEQELAAEPEVDQANAEASDEAGADAEDDGFDSEIAAIFTEEATELLDLAHASLTHWSADRTNQAVALELKRALHTIKGGARMAGIRAMGDLSHELESCMQSVEVGTIPASQGVFDVLEAALDELHRMRDTVCNGGRCAPARELLTRIRRLSGPSSNDAPVAAPAPVAPPPKAAAPAPRAAAAPAPAAQPVSQPAKVPAAAASPVRPTAAAPAPVNTTTVEKPAPAKAVTAPTPPVVAAPAPRAVEPPPVATREAAEAEIEIEIDVETAAVAPQAATVEEPAAVVLPGREAAVQDRQEFARVDADLLDKLLNGAGEVSIFRSRLEQQVSSIDFNLVELGRTVTRLKDQLRKFELEAEAQILHSRPDASRHDDFDPLELDRYSSIQQLSRALAESVSDVGSIEGLLGNLTREAQNLLLQQSRVVTELQNGLMRTRMVPFQRHVQRLSRIVRQVASETAKRAELVVDGGAGELDRQVLERMLPPFEHMLRNSVVHGIETPAERVAAGKPEKGTITLSLRREGAEVVVEIADDGRGIDVKAVRERARARGLLQSGHELSDEEALQLVLEPGFSTASSVTQHAGRGVGMDVVVTEIKRLGGGLFTESTPGKGVKFTIRLPFTLAITQSLLARIGEELYALPLATVEGVARLPRSQVQKHLAEETSTFNYGGQVYRFQHLGAFVGAGPSVLPEADIPVSVILIRAGEHSAALVSDELIGNREMVVKSVGPQISSIRGIAGATILGDGRVVIILDVGALVRSEWRFQVAAPMQAPEDRRICALVVDDSITVRRVTQRLLERHGMKVMTAKDGVDAIAVLEEQLPDVILLDIEMPRMDGYELATHVRNDPRLSQIPIVMITSRVGDKHRSRAMEIGVNDYLGKPYQEHQLLDAIEPLVAAPKRKRPR